MGSQDSFLLKATRSCGTRDVDSTKLVKWDGRSVRQGKARLLLRQVPTFMVLSGRLRDFPIRLIAETVVRDHAGPIRLKIMFHVELRIEEVLFHVERAQLCGIAEFSSVRYSLRRRRFS